MSSYFSSKNQINFEELQKILEKKKRDFHATHFPPLLQKIHSLKVPENIHTNFENAYIEMSTEDKSFDTSPVNEVLKELIPWKKGPFKFFETSIDAEWDSSLKWKRIQDHLGDLQEKTVLDIGCNNGYFLFKLLSQSPRLALGIDPVIPCYLQFEMINHFVRAENLKFELLGVEHLSLFKNTFDVILHMGILYHHRHPLQQLIDIREALTPGGVAIIETIGIEGESSTCLFPEGRYANMPNVWFVPTLSALQNWCHRTKFIDIEVISTQWFETNEQRVTPWCSKETSYIDALDPKDSTRTIEGHPAPKRFCLKVKKKG